MEIKAGYRYIRRDGKETGPLAKTRFPSVPFKDNQTDMYYRKDGKISETNEYPQDIVKEVTS